MTKQRARHMRLNRQQQLFVEQYLIDGDGPRAAKAAGYSERSAGVTASKLLKLAKVQNALAAGRASVVEQVEVKAAEVVARWRRRATTDAREFLTFRKSIQRHREMVSPMEAARRVRKEHQIVEETGRRLGWDKPGAPGHESHLAELRKLEVEATRLEVVADLEPDTMVSVEGPLVEVEVADFDLVKMRDAERLDLVRSVTRNRDGSVKVEMHDAQAADEALARYLGMFVDRHLDVGEPGEVQVVFVEPIRREPGALLPPGGLNGGHEKENGAGAGVSHGPANGQPH